jgi:SAM-dependent methyltransferase
MMGKVKTLDGREAAADTTRAGSLAEAVCCPVCDGALVSAHHAWLLRCHTCGFRRSTLVTAIEDGRATGAIDEDLRAAGLERLRRKNFERLLDWLCYRIEPHGSSLLDVGCVHGWFLEAAARRGFGVAGLEPDPGMTIRAAAAGYTVWYGFFPHHLPPDRRFDVLVFNDVFEHLPDVAQAAQACHARLVPGGLLVLNLPSSRGVFYRLGEALDRAGMSGPLERLWQKGFASPHLSYFDPDQLRQLMERHGFIEIDRSTLPSITIDGLWARLRYDRSGSAIASAAVWIGVVAAAPVLWHLPGDISLQIFRRMDRPP